MFLAVFFPLGVVVRFRTVVAENITQRPYGQQLLKLFCSWDRKNLEHVVVSCWVVVYVQTTCETQCEVS